MKLIVTEKNIAAKKLADILSVGKVTADKVYNTPVYRFSRDGEDWVAIGLKGHILGVDFPLALHHDDAGWHAEWAEGDPTPASLPDTLAVPPWTSKRKPFLADGIDMKSWAITALPYLVWAPVGKHAAEKEIVRALKTSARKADEIVIATDYDREGELIGSDARSVVRESNKTAPIKRARFSAITKDEIERAFAEIGEIEDCLAQAGEARQDIDLVWGAVLTRYLTKAKFAGVGRPRSAGRVQTPTLKLIVDREALRKIFVPEPFWVIKARVSADGAEFGAVHAEEKFQSQPAAEAAFAAVQGASEGTVTEVARKKRTQAPPTPFNTTALQAAAAAEGISPARAMRIAESLYMNGLVSYPRVDNTVYPVSLDLRGILGELAGVPQYRDFAKRLLGRGQLSPTRGAKETTDHPPIHPTAGADPDKLKPEEWKLYNLIARRFLATLGEAATLESTKVDLQIGGQPFVARGDVLVSAGFREIYPYGLKKDEQLPSLAEGQTVAVLGTELKEDETKPPARYSEGGMIQEMEKRGLGTKATRHSIIQTLLDRNYVQLEDRALRPTMLGEAVIEALSAFAERITTPDMTAELEAEMDGIASGRIEREQVVEHSRSLLAATMELLIPKVEEVGELLKEAAAFDAKVGVCPKCGKDLLAKASPKTGGQFIGCSGWPDCDVTYPLPKGKIETVDEPCPTCGTLQVKVIAFKQKPKVLCVNGECPTNYEPEVDLGACPTCAATGKDGRITSRKSKTTFKRYARCTNYDECGTSYPLPQNGALHATGETCDGGGAGCGSPMIVVETRRGPWKICIDPACPAKAEAEKAKASGKKKPAGKSAAGGAKATARKRG